MFLGSVDHLCPSRFTLSLHRQRVCERTVSLYNSVLPDVSVCE